MARRAPASATKEDLRERQANLARRIDEVEKRLEARIERETEDVTRQLEARIERGTQDVTRHFDVAVESIRHDLLGANRDEIETLKDRVGRLEHHTGLVAS